MDKYTNCYMKYNQSYTARHEYYYLHSGDSRIFRHAAYHFIPFYCFLPRQYWYRLILAEIAIRVYIQGFF